jgi:hypothetical protein
MPAHAIGDHRERNAAAFRMRNERHPILLLPAVTLVLSHTGVNVYRHSSGFRRVPQIITFGPAGLLGDGVAVAAASSAIIGSPTPFSSGKLPWATASQK